METNTNKIDEEKASPFSIKDVQTRAAELLAESGKQGSGPRPPPQASGFERWERRKLQGGFSPEEGLEISLVTKDGGRIRREALGLWRIQERLETAAQVGSMLRYLGFSLIPGARGVGPSTVGPALLATVGTLASTLVSDVLGVQVLFMGLNPIQANMALLAVDLLGVFIIARALRRRTLKNGRVLPYYFAVWTWAPALLGLTRWLGWVP